MITSTREVAREIEINRETKLREWAKNHRELFPTLKPVEITFIMEIFKVTHFQQIIEKKKIYMGGMNADIFIIARAKSINRTVVTLESKPKNGDKIPSICDHFGISYLSLEGFMEAENWTF